MAHGYTKRGAIDLRRLPIVVRRPLGRHNADGQAFHALFTPNSTEPIPPTIEIDSRLTGVKRLEIMLHELDHLLHPARPEAAILSENRYLARVLWACGLRFEDEEE